MTVNGKRDGFTHADLEACARSAHMKRGRAASIIDEVLTTVQRWPEFAAQANLSDMWIDTIRRAHRLTLPR